MASCQTTRWVSTSPYVKLTVTQSSSDGDSAALAWSLQYISDYAADAGNARPYTVVIDGATVKTGTYQIDGVTGTKTIASGTKEIAKGTSAKSVSFSCTFQFNLTWSGSYKGTLSASGSISVAAKTSYTVSYNANGGSGAPSSQTKWYGTALTLSSSKPTRTGYGFSKWNTAAGGGGTSYNAGASYTANASATLYAQWTANTYTVSYNANGGSGAPSSQTKTYGKTLTLSSTKPTRTNYTFLGWSTSAAATSATYSAGGSFTTNTNTTLYAVWELAYTKPKISSFSASRCVSDGTLAEDGTYALVKFNWSTFVAAPTITIEWQAETGGTWSSKTVAASGTSGSVSVIVGDGGLDSETSYTFRVTVADGTDSQDRYTSMSGLVFPIDFLAGNKGTAIGKPAEAFYNEDGEQQATFDVNWLSRFRNHVCVGDKVGHLDGKQGILLSNEGYIHLQRTTAQGYNPYIAFMLDDQTAVTAQIRYNSSTRVLEMKGAESYYADDEFHIEHTDLAFQQTNPDTGYSVAFGVGLSGTSHGVYSNTYSRWMVYTNKYNDTFITSPNGDVCPYFTNKYLGEASMSFSTIIRTSGYVTNSGTEVHFTIPLSKPVVGSGVVVSASSVNGFILRQGTAYTHGSGASTYVTPTSYNCGVCGGGNHLAVIATFSNTANVTNNDAIGIYASVKITFS